MWGGREIREGRERMKGEREKRGEGEKREGVENGGRDGGRVRGTKRWKREKEIGGKRGRGTNIMNPINFFSFSFLTLCLSFHFPLNLRDPSMVAMFAYDYLSMY